MVVCYRYMVCLLFVFLTHSCQSQSFNRISDEARLHQMEAEKMPRYHAVVPQVVNYPKYNICMLADSIVPESIAFEIQLNKLGKIGRITCISARVKDTSKQKYGVLIRNPFRSLTLLSLITIYVK